MTAAITIIDHLIRHPTITARIPGPNGRLAVGAPQGQISDELLRGGGTGAQQILLLRKLTTGDRDKLDNDISKAFL